MMTVARSVISLLAVAAFMVVPVWAVKADAVYRTEYEISMFALSIARSALETKAIDKAYQVNGNFKTSGLVRIFDNTQGTVHVRGKTVIGKNTTKIVPMLFNLDYQHGRKNKSTKIRFSNGNVVSAENVPPMKKREPWVETTPKDLLDVNDAVSALMIPAQNSQSVCNRTLDVFDGEIRAQIKLSFNGTESFTTKGFTGETVICSAKFVPISGYQKGRKAIDYLANRSKITISFATMGNSGIYAPVIARIGTQLGTLKISATRFEMIQ